MEAVPTLPTHPVLPYPRPQSAIDMPSEIHNMVNTLMRQFATLEETMVSENALLRARIHDLSVESAGVKRELAELAKETRLMFLQKFPSLLDGANLAAASREASVPAQYAHQTTLTAIPTSSPPPPTPPPPPPPASRHLPQPFDIDEPADRSAPNHHNERQIRPLETTNNNDNDRFRPHYPTPAESDAGDTTDSTRPAKRRATSAAKPNKPKPRTTAAVATTRKHPLKKVLIAAPDSSRTKEGGPSLIERIWTGIYGGPKIGALFDSSGALLQNGSLLSPAPQLNPKLYRLMSSEAFKAVNMQCSSIFQSTRGLRMLEIVLQASWVDFFTARIAAIGKENKFNSHTDNKMAALHEARLVFACSEKEMRNKLAIWTGYAQIKEAGGWAALIFAEEGVYTIAKYRIGMKDTPLFQELSGLRHAFCLAADTLQPGWRRLLSIIQEDTEPVFTGHPHEYTVAHNNFPVPLAQSYPWIREYKLIDKCVIDEAVWGEHDPRTISAGPMFHCLDCGEVQDDDAINNRCRCFPELYPSTHLPAPVQVFDTHTGKGNGLVSRTHFLSNAGLGEFVGLITAGKSGVDVMEGGPDMHGNKYQISQGAMGNFTRFVNHSCDSNCELRRFVWMGKERIVVAVREGTSVGMGEEVTVDYSNVYWEGLEKICKCGSERCKYAGEDRLTGGGVK